MNVADIVILIALALGAVAGFKAGQTVSVNALLHGSLMPSGSDATLPVVESEKVT